MTRDEIIRMAAEVEWEITGHDFPHSNEFIQWCERFAALVAAAEREACARICDEHDNGRHANYAILCAAAIRARGAQ